MSAAINSSPAFPSPGVVLPNGRQQGAYEGMTLRDYFAAKAMQALLSRLGPFEDDPNRGNAFPRGRDDVPDVDSCAAYAYSQADAMLAARQGGAA